MYATILTELIISFRWKFYRFIFQISQMHRELFSFTTVRATVKEKIGIVRRKRRSRLEAL
jgi:hypothetical protein